jgi:hypothetical protein
MWNQVQQALNQSMVRMLDEFANFLPGLAALIVAMVFALAVAWLLAFLLRRLGQALRFDERLQYWGFSHLADWSPGKSPTLLVSRVVFWIVVAMGFLIGIAAFDATLTSQLMFQLFGYFPSLVTAGLVVLFGNVIARFVSRSVLIGAVNMNLQYASLLATGVKWMVLVLAFAMALDHLAIGGNIVHLAFGILFGGIVLALALAVGLGSKELVSRSLEREVKKKPPETVEPFRHL